MKEVDNARHARSVAPWSVALRSDAAKEGGPENFENLDCKYCNLSIYVAYFVSNYIA